MERSHAMDRCATSAVLSDYLNNGPLLNECGVRCPVPGWYSAVLGSRAKITVLGSRAPIVALFSTGHRVPRCTNRAPGPGHPAPHSLREELLQIIPKICPPST